MPAALLHQTFVERLADDPDLGAACRSALWREPLYARLGSILFDLPFYNGYLPLMALRYGLKRPAETSYWGAKLHFDRPDRFLAHLVEQAREEDWALPRPARLAICLAAATHAVLDVVLHPLVVYCARRDTAAEGGPESHHHRLTEKYHCLYFHLDHYGFDPLGSPLMRTRTRVSRLGSLWAPRVEPELAEFVCGTLSSFYGEAPSALRFASWVQGFAHFGELLTGYYTLRNSRLSRTAENRRRYYENDIFRFPDFYERARRRAVDTLEVVRDYFERPGGATERREFLRAVAIGPNLVFPDDEWALTALRAVGRTRGERRRRGG